MILQSNYIPWKGYFDLIASADEFILLDDVQYTRRDWRNRNLIKTPAGLQWLTIPVEVKGRYNQKIQDTRVNDPNWGKKHWRSIQQAYRKAPYFSAYASRFEALYLGLEENGLSQINRAFIDTICEILDIPTRISWSMDFPPVEGKNERLINLCHHVGATHYISGPSAHNYIEPQLFEKAGIRLEYFSYDDYLPYPQLFGAFEHRVSILDLIFNTGQQAAGYMKHRKA